MYLSNYLSIYLSFYPSIYLSILPSLSFQLSTEPSGYISAVIDWSEARERNVRRFPLLETGYPLETKGAGVMVFGPDGIHGIGSSSLQFRTNFESSLLHRNTFLATTKRSS